MALRLTESRPHSVTVALPATSMRDGVAIASMVAGAIHLGAVPAHVGESPAVFFFLAVGFLQIVWGLLALITPSPALYGAAAANLGVIGVWILSRTVGLSLGATHVHVEPVGFADVAATTLEGIVVVGALMLANAGFRRRVATDRFLASAPPVAALIGVSLLAAFLFVPQHDAVTVEGHTAVAHGEEATAAAAPVDAGLAGDEKPNTHVVRALDNTFEPQRLKIEPGDTVKWVNEGAAPHTATSDTGEFASGNLDSGQTYSFTFDKEGAYFYYCEYHGSPGKNGMWGVVIVAEGSHDVPVHAAQAPAATSSGSDQAATSQVAITDNAFGPQQLQIQTGDTVAWTNNGATVHDVVADDGGFISGDLTPGSEFSETFEQPGVFYYHCSFHGAPRSGMWGVIVVTDAGEDAPLVAGGAAPAPKLPKLDRAPDTVEVRMGSSTFDAKTVKIDKGDTVVWSNASPMSHTVTAENSSFDSGMVAPGRRFTRTFERTGRFYYFCELHGSPRSGMWGVVIVSGDGKNPPKGHHPPPDRDPDPPPPPPDDGNTHIAVIDDRFRAKQVEVEVGETVVWTNRGARAHTVTAEDGSFDSGFLPAGEDFRRTFDREGRYYYFCQYHGGPREGMWGVVIVGSPDPEPSPSPSPSAEPTPSPSAEPSPSPEPSTAAGFFIPAWAGAGVLIPFSIAARRRRRHVVARDENGREETS